jgi:hypothetical protein
MAQCYRLSITTRYVCRLQRARIGTIDEDKRIKNINKNLFLLYFPKGEGCKNRRARRGWSAVSQSADVLGPTDPRSRRYRACAGATAFRRGGETSGKKCRLAMKTERDFCALTTERAHTHIIYFCCGYYTYYIITTSAFVWKCCESVKTAYYII